MVKKLLYGLLAALIVIQFFHPKKNNAPGPQPNYIGTNYYVPTDVKNVLSRACMDCHSNLTIYPWYSKIQPIDWWLNDHIVDGKRHLNFDEFITRPLYSQYHKLEETIEQVKEGEMPLNSYTWTHADARLTADEKNLITGWAQAVMDTMKARYPADSLKRPKKPGAPASPEKKEGEHEERH